MTMQGLLHTTWHPLFNSRVLWTISAVSLKLCVFAHVGETKLTASVAISCSNIQVCCYSKDKILIQAILKVFRHWHHEGCGLMGCSEDFKSVRMMQKFEATWNNEGDWQPAWEVWFDAALTHLAAWNLWRLLPRIPVKRMLQPFCLEH